MTIDISTREQRDAAVDAPTATACRHLVNVVQTFQQMRFDIVEQIKYSIKLITALVESWETLSESRIRRWNPIGSVISTLTGLVTEVQLNPIKQMLRTAQQQAYHANQVWRAGSSHFVTSVGSQGVTYLFHNYFSYSGSP